MTAQPRKFSEKIAVHNQKQAEGDAAFRKIMDEVSGITSSKSARREKIKVVRNQVGGSLPNVNNLPCDNSPVSDDGFVKPGRTSDDENHSSRMNNTRSGYRERGRSVGSGGPIRLDRKIDTSPYSSGPYLSPPSADLICRRANSDSALHQTVQNPPSTLHSPGSQRRAALEKHYYERERSVHENTLAESRPKSCSRIPCSIPDINIFPSVHEPGTIQIPIGNNTGSLPDLTAFTNFQFNSIGFNCEDNNNNNNRDSRINQTTYGGRMSGGGGGGNMNNNNSSSYSRNATPPHEMTSQTYNNTPNVSSKHLSVPYANSRFMLSCNGYTALDGNNTMMDNTNNYNNHNGTNVNTNANNNDNQFTYKQMQHSAAVPPDTLVLNNHMYRSPQSINRPSPQSSPILTSKCNSTSPLSAPESPTSSCNSLPGSPFNHHHHQQQQLNHNDYYVSSGQIPEAALQQHFQQITMLDSPVSVSEYMLTPLTNGTLSPYQQHGGDDNMCHLSGNSLTRELTSDQGYYSTSPTSLHNTIPPSSSSASSSPYSNHQRNNQQHILQNGPSAPNTPTSIPHIILTDFSSAEEDMSKELNDIANFFPQDDDSLRNEFDLDNLMLENPDLLNSDNSNVNQFSLNLQ